MGFFDLPAPALQAVDAAGVLGELVRGLEQHQRHAHRHHQAREVRAAQHEEARHVARERGDGDRHGEPQQRVAEAVLGEQPRGVRADAEERRVAERDDAGVAQDEVEREREQRQDRDLVDQRRVLPEDKAARVIELVSDLDALCDVREIMDIVRT